MQAAPSSSSRGSSVHRASGSSRLAMRAAGLPPRMQDVGSLQLPRAPPQLLRDDERRRLDASPDAAFYATPRMMQHAEPEALDALTGLYAAVLPPCGAVLELCASAHSHLPPGLQLRSCVGTGMNADELGANAALSGWWVQDLNEQPHSKLKGQVDGVYDAVLCINGVQYLTQPEAVLSEACRVLRPRGLLVLAFGDHCFREKAWAGWLTRSMLERGQLLSRMLQANGFGQVLQLHGLDGVRRFSGNAARQQRSGAAAEQAAAAAAEQAAAAGTGPPVELCVLLAQKPERGGGGAALLGGGVGGAAPDDMRADNVAAWFSKPGLRDLASYAAAEQQQQQQQQPLQLQQPQQQASERLLEQWRGAYDVLVGDAVALGIPRSAVPRLQPHASAAEVQAALEHLQAMVASFMSAGL